jgi:hypothetical protein
VPILSRSLDSVTDDIEGAVYRDQVQRMIAAANVRKSQQTFRSKSDPRLLRVLMIGKRRAFCPCYEVKDRNPTMLAECTGNWKYTSAEVISMSRRGDMAIRHLELII